MVRPLIRMFEMKIFDFTTLCSFLILLSMSFVKSQTNYGGKARSPTFEEWQDPLVYL